MKKGFVFILALTILLTACVGGFATSFSGVKLDCTENKSYTDIGTWKATKAGKIYVYHTVSTSSAGYTNHFRIYVGTANAVLGKPISDEQRRNFGSISICSYSRSSFMPAF